jgi:hypothetical protein
VRHRAGPSSEGPARPRVAESPSATRRGPRHPGATSRDPSSSEGSRAWSYLVKEVALPVETIDGPFGEITYLPSLIEMTDVVPGFDRSAEPLGSSSLTWW